MRRALRSALVLAFGVAACKENAAPPAPTPLTREAVVQAVAAKKEAQSPKSLGGPAPWGHWERVSLGKPYLRINSVWGTSAQDVWVLGSQRLETVVGHDDGLGFKVAQSLEGQGSGVLGGRSASDRWIVGTFARHATDGELAQALDLVGSRELRSLTADPAGTLWAVGEHGQVLHQAKPDEKWASEVAGPDVPGYAGGKTSPTRKGEESKGTVKAGLNAVWATRDLVMAVGEVGTLLRRTPSAGWETLASGTLNELRGVWGTSPNDIWAVGDRGTILHYTGGGDWAAVSSGTSADLYAVWGNSPSDLWAVGTIGALLHFDGTVWTPIPSGTQEVLLAMWGDGKGELWAVGDNATILHHLPK